jgi:hypothetical protein
MKSRSEHKFGLAPAGTGRLRVCTVCGERETKEAADPHHPQSACNGRPVIDPACETDYEPI